MVGKPFCLAVPSAVVLMATPQFPKGGHWLVNVKVICKFIKMNSSSKTFFTFSARVVQLANPAQEVHDAQRLALER